MSELSLEKQFAHSIFCQQVKDITNIESAKKLLEDLHLLYLGQQSLFIQLAKQDAFRDYLDNSQF
jgi:RNA binding exosome subunit